MKGMNYGALRTGNVITPKGPVTNGLKQEKLFVSLCFTNGLKQEKLFVSLCFKVEIFISSLPALGRPHRFLFAHGGFRDRKSVTKRPLKNLCVFSAQLLELLAEDPLGLVNNPKSCYVVQKLVAVAPKDMLEQLASIVRQNFLHMSINAYGCFVVQALLSQPNLSSTQASHSS